MDMPDYREKIINHYAKGKEDGRHKWSRTTQLEFHYTEKHIAPFIKPTDRVLEIGCATGYYAMRFADRCREYVGIDLFAPHIEQFKTKIAESGLTNVSCETGDVTNLEVSDASFDVVLCLGPMYHLPPELRALAFAECMRVCKPGGIAAFAYINRIGVYAGACTFSKWRSRYPNAVTNDFVLRQGTDDEKPYVFYFTTPEEIEKESSRSGFTKLRNLGLDFFFMMEAVDAMDDERFDLFLPLSDEMASHESCTGMSNHALLICYAPR